LVFLLGSAARLELVELGLALPRFPLESAFVWSRLSLGLQDGLFFLMLFGLFLAFSTMPNGEILRGLQLLTRDQFRRRYRRRCRRISDGNG